MSAEEKLIAHADPLAAMQQALPKDEAAFWPAVRTLLAVWCHSFDRAAPVQRKNLRPRGGDITVAGMDGFSPTHVAGAQLCRLLHEAGPAAMAAHRIERDLYSRAPAVRVSATQIRHMAWPELADLVTALQISLHDIVRLESSDTGPRVSADVDVLELIVLVLTRAGFWTTRAWRQPPQRAQPCEAPDSDEDTPARRVVPEHIVTDSHGWTRIERHAIVQLLDACHAMASVLLALLDADIAPANDAGVTALLADITEHHREVTLDAFYELSMLAAIHPGMVAQYKHRHQEVFHSISQVVYYNWPSYTREKQAAFNDMMKDRKPINVLPLVVEMLGNTPVLHEHTGALHAPTHARFDFAFVLIGRYYALVTRGMRVLLHTDVLQLAALVLRGLSSLEHGLEQTATDALEDAVADIDAAAHRATHAAAPAHAKEGAHQDIL